MQITRKSEYIMKIKLLVAGAVIMTGVVSAAAGEPPAEVKQIWEKDCAKCHGLTGKADTKAGKKIGAIDFTDPKNQEKFTDEQMFKAIKEGVNDKDGRIKMKKAENANDDLIKGLIAFIRTLRK